MTTATKNKIQFSAHQQSVIDNVVGEIARNARDLSIGGLAGTGKSTVSAQIVEDIKAIGYKVSVLCPTGKAANVLRTKGINADTIHSAIYNFGGKYTNRHNDREEINWIDKDGILDNPDILVVDETSMVNAKQAADLRQFNLPIIWVGDYGQLPPVGKDPGIMRHPDFILHENFRVGKGNDIVDFALSVREGEILSYLNDAKVHQGAKMIDFIDGGYDQMILGFNGTRRKVNALYRKRNKLKGILQERERIICVHNNRRLGIYNGMQLIVKRINNISDVIDCTVQPVDYPDKELEVNLLPECFGAEQYDTEAIKGITKGLMCDYGYAITCHKSQGSEWDNILVLNQSSSFWDQKRWLYTAATRASKKLDVIL